VSDLNASNDAAGDVDPDHVNALLAGIDSDLIDGGEQVAQYLGMADSSAQAEKPVQEKSAPAGKAPEQAAAPANAAAPAAAPQVNTIEPSDEGRAAATATEKADDKAGPEVQGGKDDDTPVKAIPILKKDGYTLPKSVAARYVAVEGKFVDRKTEQISFEDNGKKLSTKNEDRATIENMIAVAGAKNWSTLYLQGTDAFRQQAWIAAQVAGLETIGYEPSKEDLAVVQARREEMRIAAGEKASEPTRDNTISPGDKEQDLDKGQTTGRVLTDKQSVAVDSLKAMLFQRGLAAEQVEKAVDVATSHFLEDRVHVGKVVEHGSAPYEHNADNSASYYVKLATEQGEQTVWGVDLARGAGEGLLKVGEDVALAYQGRTEVVVPTKELDVNGKPTGRMTETVAHRNTWEVLPVDKLRDIALGKELDGGRTTAAQEQDAPKPAVSTPTSAPQMTPEQLKAIRDEIAADRKTLEARERAEKIAQFKDPKFREARAKDLLRAVGRDPAEFFDENGAKPADQQGRTEKDRENAIDAPGAVDAGKAAQPADSSKEAVMRLMLESELDKNNVPEADRQAARDELNAVFADARAKGVELEIPEPLVVDRAMSAEPSQRAEINHIQPTQAQEVDR